MLTGDTRLACEAILCLSSGTRPSECTPSLSRYFNITKRKLSDTIRARLNFLQLCPVASQTPEMQSLVSAISRGAGRCDAQSLNSTLVMWTGGYDDGRTYISNQLPDYCGAYTGHAYTDFASSGTLPRWRRDARAGRVLGRSATMTAPWPSTTNASGARTKSAAVSPG